MEYSTAMSHPPPRTPAGYVNPPLHYPMIPLSELPDPPPDWFFLGTSYKGVHTGRKLRRAEVEQAVDFYGWGINMEIERMSIEVGARALWKLFYNHTPQHRPTSYSELKDFTRDAGPRLLSISITHPRLRPISRYYPHPPDVLAAPQPGYVRPLIAASTIPDSYIEQMLYPATGGALGSNQDDTNSEREPSVDSMKDCHCPRDTVPLSGVTARAVIESVERAVLRFALPQLERDSSATPRYAPRPYVNAEMNADLLRYIVGSFPATATLKLSPSKVHNHRLTFDPFGGREFPYRGRGPVWNNNSSAIDCIIVAGKLLDAGSTIMDREDKPSLDGLTPIQRAFIEVTDANWDTFNHQMSWRLRDQFWDLLAENLQQVRGPGVGPLWTIWHAVTANMAQFAYTFDEEVHYCPCMKQPPHQLRNETLTSVFPPSCLSPHPPVPMQTVLNRAFAPIYKINCPKCGAKEAVVHDRIVHRMPARMVVSTDGTEAIRHHTRDIAIDYVTADGVPKTATYRWLGGVYCRDGNFRLYWTETGRGERDTGEIAVYDSTMCLGSIIGGISQEYRHDKVPELWWKNQLLPLVFYERIDNPSSDVLKLALQTVSDLVHADHHDRNLLQTHVQWSRPESSEAGKQWRHNLPAGGRFELSTAGEEPGVGSATGYELGNRWRRTMPATGYAGVGSGLGPGLNPGTDNPKPPANNSSPSFNMTSSDGVTGRAAPAQSRPDLNAFSYPEAFLQAGMPVPEGFPPSAYELNRNPAGVNDWNSGNVSREEDRDADGDTVV